MPIFPEYPMNLLGKSRLCTNSESKNKPTPLVKYQVV